MDIKQLIRDEFQKNGGKLLLKTTAAQRVLEYGRDWMAARVSDGNGAQYIEFGKSKNAEKRYRIDHCICYRYRVDVLKRKELGELFTGLVQKKYGNSPSRDQVINMYSDVPTLIQTGDVKDSQLK